MLTPGLVSITFRQLSPRQIVELVAQAQLTGIEWGGDIHVPHGDIAQARRVAQMTTEAGLRVAAYGSYYRVGHPEDVAFEAVLESAVALGAPLIRVWAGKQGTDSADDAYFQMVVEDTRRIADLAAARSIPIVYEFHRNTLTDTNNAARRLLEAVDHPNVRSYWQPPRGSNLNENLAGLQTIKPWLAGLHVFHWDRVTFERLPLLEDPTWMDYLHAAHVTGYNMYALLEFVRDDDPQQFLADAATLRTWLASLGQHSQ